MQQQISVIIPVYMTAQYLRRCVDSFLAQTYQEFELILVDDGSPDNAGAICDEYAEKDRRIVALHRENGGPSAARNTGIEWVLSTSNSTWILFADSDDWVHPKMLENLLNANLNNGTRISICSFMRATDEETLFPAHNGKVSIVSPEQYCLEYGLLANAAWSKLYHKSCFAQKRFPMGKFHEDMYVVPHVLFAEDRLSLLTDAYYAYFLNMEGITGRRWNPARLDMMGGFDSQLKLFHDVGAKKLVRATIEQYLISSVFHLIQLSSDRNAENSREYKKFYHRKIWRLLCYSLKHRIPMKRLFRELGDGVSYRISRLPKKLFHR